MTIWIEVFLIGPTPRRFHLLTHLLAKIGFQIPHRRFQILMPHPMLDRAQVNSSPEVSCRKCRAELVQPEVIRTELRAFCNRLAVVQEARKSCVTRSHIWAIELCLSRLSPGSIQRAQSGWQFQRRRRRVVSQRQGSQRDFNYALQFTSARAARCLDCYSVDDRRDIAAKVSGICIGRQITI